MSTIHTEAVIIEERPIVVGPGSLTFATEELDRQADWQEIRQISEFCLGSIKSILE